MLGIQGCAVFEPPILTNTNEPGQLLSQQVIAGSKITNQDIDKYIPKTRAFSNTHALAKKNLNDLIELLERYTEQKDLITALKQLADTDATNNDLHLAFALSLFPLQRHPVVDELLASNTYGQGDIQRVAKMVNIDLNTLTQNNGGGLRNATITPLIHSVSIKLDGFSENSENKLWFKPKASNMWQPGHGLHYVPVTGMLSGSIVHLSADTEYEIKIRIVDNNKTFERKYAINTRRNSPPINSDNIIYLRDIYNGGALDLSNLDIDGTENSWTKIIGDDVIIDAGSDDFAALNLGDAKYVMLENITTTGGQRFGIHALKAHHIWINGCNVSRFGRVAKHYRRGKGYVDSEAEKPINYDAGIFLQHSGVIVIENCEIHSPNHSANHWGKGHPLGASAMLVSANHPVDAYSGQYIVRYNRFFGSEKARFNDVIESRLNVRRHGGFVRDSAIHDNYLGFANDDVIELDGGQSNVLVYNNTITQGYCGISLAPNMQGPSFVFNNDIVNLGDERGAQWAAFKMGGLFSAPAGKTFLFQNYVDASANGVATAGLRGDSTFWVETQNNIIRLSSFRDQRRGYGIKDPNSFYLNIFKGDFILNLITQNSEIQTASEANKNSYYRANELEISQLQNGSLKQLRINDTNQINNFSYPPTRIDTISSVFIPVGVLNKY